jgi:F0F1-type ATP synthase membrane subunit c/vacuolar-type H+-ATPase subunit K
MDAATDQTRLYTTAQIATASLIGGPLPACWFIAHNFDVLDQPRRGHFWRVGGIVSVFALLGLVILGILQYAPQYVFPIAYTIGLREWARKTQGEAITAHRAAGRPMGSWPAVIGFGIISLVVCFGLVFGILLLFPSLPLWGNT